MTNEQIIAKLSQDLIRKIKGLIVAGMTFEQAYANAKAASCAGSAVWVIVDAEFAAPGVYCWQDEEGFAVYTNVTL